MCRGLAPRARWSEKGNLDRDAVAQAISKRIWKFRGSAPVFVCDAKQCAVSSREPYPRDPLRIRNDPSGGIDIAYSECDKLLITLLAHWAQISDERCCDERSSNAHQGSRPVRMAQHRQETAPDYR